jgi:OCT family organic cation transporter-like MFS transporter 4/5
MQFLLLFVFLRCAIPGVDNDTYAIQNEAHWKLIQELVPYKRNGVHNDWTYSECTLYNTSLLSTNITDDGESNSTETTCDRWVYDQTVYQSTVISDVSTTTVIIDLNMYLLIYAIFVQKYQRTPPS